jgi:hypothetical protein
VSLLEIRVFDSKADLTSRGPLGESQEQSNFDISSAKVIKQLFLESKIDSSDGLPGVLGN